MRVRFTKMQGAGNDFVVLDETRQRLKLTPEQYRQLADRHFGVGADQILSVRPAPAPGIDFEYVIHNADGGEVEQCGNGARCFARYVADKGLARGDRIRCQTISGVIEPRLNPTAASRWTWASRSSRWRSPLRCRGPEPAQGGGWQKWHLALGTQPSRTSSRWRCCPWATRTRCRKSPTWTRARGRAGPADRAPFALPERVNAGFMQVLDRARIKLRVWERGAGETLACGTGACAAVVAGIRLGRLDPRVDVETAAACSPSSGRAATRPC
jgi:diaminopimelate epimerase